MAKKPKPKPDDKEQSQRFIETAKQLEVDESGKSFQKAFNSIKHHHSSGHIANVSSKNSRESKK